MVKLDTEVALFIDLENIATSLWKSIGQQPNPARLIEHAKQYGRITLARVYADFTTEGFHHMESAFRNANIEPFQCPAKVRGESVQSTVDMNMVIDMYEAAQDRPTIETFVVMAGDSDYVRVVARLRHRFDKKVIVAAVPGSVSRDLIEAAGIEDPLEAAVVTSDDEAEIIRILVQYEDSRYEGVLPTFRNAADYVKHPANHIDPSIVESVLNELVQRGVLVQTLEETREGQPIRTTRLDRSNPEVAEALGEGMPS
jgi:uncharacterized LabA/DUF88 family protein